MRLLLALFTCLLLVADAAFAQPAIDPDAQVVHLRESCALPGSADLDNCFETTPDLTTWLWGGSGRSAAPSAADRVAVHVGPGTFAPFECDGSSTARGYVSLVGSGREQSRFVRNDGATGPAGSCAGAIHVHNCREMDFSHLMAQGFSGVVWVGGGGATWSDVDIVGKPGPEQTCSSLGVLGWYDFPGEGGQSRHFFFGSRVIGRGGPLANIAFDSTSADSWFYGGDIVAEPDVATSAGNVAVLLTGPAAELRVFGSSIRARVGAATAMPFSFFGFRGVETNGGIFHMHGGIINVMASDSTVDVDVEAIQANGATAFVHTPGTGFVAVAGGSGTATRTVATNGAVIQSPFVWPSGASPPAAESLHGSDLFVDTDAGASGGEAHLMVRDVGCTGTGGPWRDMVTGSCRP